MLYGLLFTLFILVAILLVLIIMIQQGKGSTGLGNLGGGAQMLFGGSGGQDVFQKTTWVLGALFMLGSFGLTLMKSRGNESSRFMCKKPTPTQQLPMAPVVSTPAQESVPSAQPAPTQESAQ